MIRLRLVSIWFILFGFFSCYVLSGDLILPGKYINKNSGEFVLINGGSVNFYLYDNKNRAYFEKQYNYLVSDDERVRFYPLTSVEAVFGIGQYDWYQKENTIHRLDPKTKELLIFEYER